MNLYNYLLSIIKDTKDTTAIPYDMCIERDDCFCFICLKKMELIDYDTFECIDYDRMFIYELMEQSIYDSYNKL